MSTKFTNIHEIDLSMAVWLVHDDYDFIPKEQAISATALLKPTRQIVLGQRVTGDELEDLSARISMRLGHAIHDSVEQAWVKSYARNMALLGLPQKVIDKVKVNPDPKTVEPDDIPVYIEQRGYRKLGDWTVSGKLDMSLNYRLKDAKSTSVFTYLKGGKDEDYRLQGSMYKWIHPEKVKDDEMDIQFLFTDWQKSMVNTIPGYPPIRLLSYPVPLYSEKEIENWMMSKIEDLVMYKDAPDEAIPRCTDEELWRTDPQWKYYANAAKTDGKSSKNFDNPGDANAHMAAKGTGVVIPFPGKVKACMYCRAFSVCEQRKEYTFDE